MHAFTGRRSVARRYGLFVPLLSALLLTGCGGGGGSPAAEHSLTASVKGLTASGLVLAVNGADVSVASNSTSIQLSGVLSSGTAYSVIVQAQPTGLQCVVSNGSGTMGAVNVSTVAVSCQPETYTVGGTANGVSASGLVLANGSSSLPVPVGATSFTMPAAVASGSTYDITVQTQPNGLQCVVSAGYGTVASAPVTSVIVTCTSQAEWVWTSGSSTWLAAGVYGSKGVAAAGNVPGARQLASAWAGAAGVFWLFGGRSPSNGADFDDLWLYRPATDEWTWVSGSNTVGTAGVYGTLGVPAVGNMPGARDGAASWVDAAGNLWLFGGEEYAGAAGSNYFNDLWKYDPSTGEWTWISGADSVNAAGIYGVKGLAAAGDVPGARAGAVTWVDAAGNLWLFGGIGYDGAGVVGELADLWEFNVSAHEWVWVGGSSTVDSAGVYGAKGIATASNLPGARQYAVSWVDATGNFWLFGGEGYDSTGSNGDLGDLWRYDPKSGQWTWESGSNTVGSTGFYGTQGVEASANVPGARVRSNAWTDAHGNLWLFGGVGYGSSGSAGLNDLWMYDVASGQWTWEGGSSAGNAMGVYGTEGIPAAANVPGSRSGAVAWADSSGRLWLFGGMGCATGTGTCVTQSFLNDLWSY